jgi:Holliday junction resolvase RusA-like endonuclease
VKFKVFGKPQPAGSKTIARTKKGGIFVRDANPAVKDWKALVSQVAGEHSDRLLAGPLSLSVTFYLARPKSHYGRRGLLPSAPAFPITAPDATKLLRGVEDAMQDIVYRNDAQIVDQSVSKRFGEPARVEIEVLPKL